MLSRKQRKGSGGTKAPGGHRGVPRKKRARPEPRQYRIADLERARDRVEAAERRVDSDRTSKPDRSQAALERARIKLRAIEANLRARGFLK